MPFINNQVCLQSADPYDKDIHNIIEKTYRYKDLVECVNADGTLDERQAKKRKVFLNENGRGSVVGITSKDFYSSFTFPGVELRLALEHFQRTPVLHMMDRYTKRFKNRIIRALLYLFPFLSVSRNFSVCFSPLRFYI